MLRLRVPHLRPCKKRSIQHRGPQRPHHKQHNDAVTALLQAGANQKRGDSRLRPSIARPQGLSTGARGPLRPIRNVMHFSKLAEYSQKCTLGSAPPIRSGQHALVLPISGHRRGTKSPAARSTAGPAASQKTIRLRAKDHQAGLGSRADLLEELDDVVERCLARVTREAGVGHGVLGQDLDLVSLHGLADVRDIHVG